jgi:GH25 family lysozyme M1 (1,4-beta-N-acetylmuramidase)
MSKICPRCGGNEVGCPVCGYPPKRVLPKSDIYTGKPSLRARLFGLPVWEVQGIDISKWNGRMNFAITKTKCQYVNIRYGYGNGWADPSAVGFYAGARAQDMPVAAYWFCNIGEDPEAHAQGFAEELASKPIQLDAHLDFERTTLTSPSSTLAWIQSVDVKLNVKTGKIEIPYTSMGFWNEKVARSSYWVGRKLWDATWTTRDAPTLPLDFSEWDEWQWSADNNLKAAEYGSSGGDPDMDLDRSHLTVAQFNAKHGTHILPIGGTIPPPPGGVPERVVVNIGEMNIRSAPDPVNINTIGTTKMGQFWYPEAVVKDQFGKEWYQCGRKVFVKKELTRLP